MKYIIYIDYKVNNKRDYEYRALNAKTFKEAIEEADKIHNPDTMYLIRIMEKASNVEKKEGYKTQMYKAIECKRSCGWYANTDENSESEHIVKRCYMTVGNHIEEWYECQ